MMMIPSRRQTRSLNFCENRMEWYLPGGSGRSGSHCSRTLPELLPGLVGYPGIPGHPGST